MNGRYAISKEEIGGRLYCSSHFHAANPCQRSLSPAPAEMGHPNKRIRSICNVSALLCCLLGISIPVMHAKAGEFGLCIFDSQSLQFAGTPVEQAKCLLRKVKTGAELGPALTVLPQPLDSLVGHPVTITKASLRAYLAAQKISEGSIGGSLDKPVSQAANSSMGIVQARYFVIHDTSTPNCSDMNNYCVELGKMPANLDDADWPYNQKYLIQRDKNGYPVAHVFIGRTGISQTGHDLSSPWRATKLESNKVVGFRSKGLFLHVENVQPRVGNPPIAKPGKRVNDLIAPVPGFTVAQYERLALVYAAASVRRGEWLVPGFHAVIDSGISDAHDDPQNFDLDAWALAVEKLIAIISLTVGTANPSEKMGHLPRGTGLCIPS